MLLIYQGRYTPFTQLEIGSTAKKRARASPTGTNMPREGAVAKKSTKKRSRPDKSEKGAKGGKARKTQQPKKRKQQEEEDDQEPEQDSEDEEQDEEPEQPQEDDDQEDDDQEDGALTEEQIHEKQRKAANRRRNLNNCARRKGYRQQALKAGLGVNDHQTNVFSLNDIVRMVKFFPLNIEDGSPAFDPEEAKHRAAVAMLKMPPSTANALRPFVEAHARAFCIAASEIAHCSGKTTVQPAHLLHVVRKSCDMFEFNPLMPKGLLRYCQRHNKDGVPLGEVPHQGAEPVDSDEMMLDASAADIENESEEILAGKVKNMKKLISTVAETVAKKKSVVTEPTPLSKSHLAPGKGKSKKINPT